MVIDTSAIIAILWNTEDRARCIEAIQAAPVRLMSAVSAYEASVVVFARRKSKADVSALWELLQIMKVQIDSLAKSKQLPLLFQGDDFARTDVLAKQ
jgi:uncharacterized protein with PIN domain